MMKAIAGRFALLCALAVTGASTASAQKTDHEVADRLIDQLESASKNSRVLEEKLKTMTLPSTGVARRAVDVPVRVERSSPAVENLERDRSLRIQEQILKKLE